MKYQTPNFFIAAAILVILTAPAYSQEHREVPNRAGAATTRPSAVTLRLGTSAVVVPAPAGYEEASSQFENIRIRFTETEAPSNEMLLVHLLSSDCDLLRSGQAPTMAQYTKVSVLRTAKEQAFSQADLQAVVAEFRKNGAAMLDPNGPRMKAVLEHVEQALKKVDSPDATLDMSQPINMGEFEVSPNIYSVMILMSFKTNEGKMNPVLAAMSFMRVQERLLYVFSYRKYKLRTDVDTLRTFAKTWTASILAAN